MSVRRLLLLFMTLWGCILSHYAQDIPDVTGATDETAATPVEIKVKKSRAYYKGDSIPAIILPTFHKYEPIVFKTQKEREKYNRLVANVKKLLPLAKLAKYTIIETYDFLQTLPTPEARAEHLTRVEKGLEQQYGPTLKKLSRSQGRLLVKLINRECGQTGYNIAQAFIGAFKANVYQTLAYCFGNSLNKRYDPDGDDRFTERVVRMVESGQL